MAKKKIERRASDNEYLYKDFHGDSVLDWTIW